MARNLYTKSKIIIPNPYVIRVDHEFNVDDALAFRALPKLARERVCGTWGHSGPLCETVALAEDITVTNNVVLNGLYAALNTNVEYKTRSYWFFEDRVDATSFRLSIGESALHVFMWPANLRFTVYENVEDIAGGIPDNES